MKVKSNIDKIGVGGILLTALLSPCCFPLFAFIGSAIGLGSFEVFGGWTMWLFQGMVIVSLIGFYISYRKHHCLYPILIALPSAGLIVYGYHVNSSDHWIYLLYAGMLGLLIATVVNYYRNNLHCCSEKDIHKDKEVQLTSTLTCPVCGHQKEEIMPTDSCVYFYECEQCKTRLKPLHGDCCVYCSYGSHKCPPIQSGEKCC